MKTEQLLEEAELLREKAKNLKDNLRFASGSKTILATESDEILETIE